MAGTVTFTHDRIPSAAGYYNKFTVSWTSDGSGNADLAIPGMSGWLIKMVTDPGAAAPTDNYDITLIDENSLDVLVDTGLNRDTANTEQVYPVVTNAQTPIFLCGSHTFTVANAGASKNGTAIFYILEKL